MQVQTIPGLLCTCDIVLSQAKKGFFELARDDHWAYVLEDEELTDTDDLQVLANLPLSVSRDSNLADLMIVEASANDIVGSDNEPMVRIRASCQPMKRVIFVGVKGN
jgi:hypothetical protein